MDQDRVVKVQLFSCVGSKINHKRKNHVYCVDEFLSSKRKIENAYFMSKKEATKKYKPLGLEVVVLKNSHKICLDCFASHIPELTRNEVREEFYPDYRGP